LIETSADLLPFAESDPLCYFGPRVFFALFGVLIAGIGGLRAIDVTRSGQHGSPNGVGLHRTYYSGIERGVRNVSLVNIEKIAKGLKTELPKLFQRL